MAIVFNEFDRCPACKKKCKSLWPDGRMFMAGGAAVCPKCGNVFLPRSFVFGIYDHKDDVIIKPGKPNMSVIGHG